jgi:cysteine-rich repeat protein
LAHPFTGYILPADLPTTVQCYTQDDYTTGGWQGPNPDGFAHPYVKFFQTFTRSFATITPKTVDFTGTHHAVVSWGPYAPISFGGDPICSDVDFDGICNDDDICPLDPTNDEDNDNICGEIDNCPLISNPIQTDANGNGQGDACESFVCGNFLLQGSEECDDGNAEGGDGCSTICTIEAPEPPVVDSGDGNPLVFGNTYVSTGALAKIYGNIQANTYITTGAYSLVTGSIRTGTAATLGANSVNKDNVLADAAVTTGASAVVDGTVMYGTAFTPGGGSSTGTATNTTSPPSVTFDNQRVSNARYGHNLKGPGTLLAATMTTNTTLSPGVYSAPSLATTASITVTLEGNNDPNEEWIFNITDILSFGASTIIKLVDVHDDSRIIWNSGWLHIGRLRREDLWHYSGTYLYQYW